MKISAVVLTKNEEKNIKACLKSLVFCDEIIVIDDFSKDKTREIAEQMGARVLKRQLEGNFSSQRNFALRQTSAEWVLFVDGDERISSDLAGEILNYESRIMNYDGFYFKRRDYFLGKWLRYGETAKVKLLRLAKKKAGKWQGKVHENWKIEKGRIGELKHPLFHYSHPTINQFLDQINKYTSLRAKELTDFRWSRMLFYPILKFIQNYFLRFGFLDGFPGLVIAWLMSYHSLIVRVKIWELNNA